MGKRVKVLFKNGVLREGFISTYVSNLEQHRIKYTMNMEETKVCVVSHYVPPTFIIAEVAAVNMFCHPLTAVLLSFFLLTLTRRLCLSCTSGI